MVFQNNAEILYEASAVNHVNLARDIRVGQLTETDQHTHKIITTEGLQ